jgi:hypothetical protein
MKFSTMANTAGGGQQVPGFIGVGKAYITSRKFISAEGGIRRIVWMPKDLKDFLREDLDKAAKAFGVENFTDMIADETNGTDTASVQAFMLKVNHPALTMWDITTPSEEAAAVDAARGGSKHCQSRSSGGGRRGNYHKVRYRSRGGRASRGPSYGNSLGSPPNCTPGTALRGSSFCRTSAARRWSRHADHHAGTAAEGSTANRDSAWYDGDAADGGLAGLDRHALAACRSQHADDAIRDVCCSCSSSILDSRHTVGRVSHMLP